MSMTGGEYEREAREWMDEYENLPDDGDDWLPFLAKKIAQRDQEHARREAEEAFGELGDLVTCHEGKKHPIVRTNGVRDRCLYCERDEATSALSALRQDATNAIRLWEGTSTSAAFNDALAALRTALEKLEKPVSGS